MKIQKTEKLSINKFVIAKINNSNQIFGGNDDNDTANTIIPTEANEQ